MDYWQYDFKTADAEILTAFIADLPFEMFEENEVGLAAFMPASADAQVVDNELVSLQKRQKFTFSKTLIKGENWNEEWEKNFHPVVVEDWVGVRADFHDPLQNVAHELVINPKMAFGTGHHETTWQCLHACRDLEFRGKKVCDFGCGSGILGIFSSRLGASEVELCDIEEESFLNTKVNGELNGAANLTVRWGGLETIEGRDFDVIFANIIRSVILESLPALFEKMAPRGILIASGFLKEDEKIIVSAAAENGFSLVKMTQRGNWLCGVFERK